MQGDDRYECDATIPGKCQNKHWPKTTIMSLTQSLRRTWIHTPYALQGEGGLSTHCMYFAARIDEESDCVSTHSRTHFKHTRRLYFTPGKSLSTRRGGQRTVTDFFTSSCKPFSMYYWRQGASCNSKLTELSVGRVDRRIDRSRFLQSLAGRVRQLYDWAAYWRVGSRRVRSKYLLLTNRVSFYVGRVQWRSQMEVWVVQDHPC